eukprot:TRINITY_DN33560_c0_g1_i1.p1 TRINITY_DN33560_c0_g1~~TRINITY_DN33560_c0_g1_i1.p1  ORF type:complete len:169 (+),score=29.39 TRINITY_DN33560_c0_g1_i1:69-575(+)
MMSIITAVTLLLVALPVEVRSLEDEDVIIPSGMGKVKVLNDNTFEHQTQATSGSTTGNWIVLLCRDGCSEEDEKKFAEGAKLYWDSFIFAKLEPGKSQETLDRFKAYLRKTPTVAVALSRGKMASTPKVQEIDRWVATLQPTKFRYSIPKEKSIIDNFIHWVRDKTGL